MIKVKHNGAKVTITGHADYDEHGRDIVCASTSSIVYTTVNAILKFDKDAIDFTDKKGKMTIIITEENHITMGLLLNMIELLKDLQREYPQNIKISKGD